MKKTGRGFGKGKKRSWYSAEKLKKGDYIALAVSILAFVIVSPFYYGLVWGWMPLLFITLSRAVVLKNTLQVTLKEALEFNRQDALSAAGSGYKEERIAV